MSTCHVRSGAITFYNSRQYQSTLEEKEPFYPQVSPSHQIQLFMYSPVHRIAVTAASTRMQLREYGDENPDLSSHQPVTPSTPQPAPVNTATSTTTLHDQDLVDVMAELERCQVDRRAAFAFNMAKGGRIHPLNDDELKQFRKEKGGVFGSSTWDTPTLSTELPFTFTSLPSPAAVEKAIKSDIGGENHFRFAPSRGSPDDDALAIMRLLDNIGNARYSEPGTVVHMQSPTFNRKRRWIPGWDGDGMLGQSDFLLTIAPAGEVFELEYHDHHFSTTLLTGSKVWLTFPPLQANLDLIRKAYGDMHAANTSRVALDVLAVMQHGIFIIQKPGQTLLFPPFWSVMTFCTKTSTSCGFSLATAAQYMYRIKNMDHWLTANLFWDTGEDQQMHLEEFAAELATHFSLIMTGDFKRFKVANVQNAICSEWIKTATKNNPNVENMKEKIGALLSLIDNEEEREKIDDAFRVAWIEFIQLKRKKKPECRLCHMRIDHMPAGETPDDRLARHVTDVHCDF
ncbi:hypothetical protein G6011_08033 [Alternaria panax]|uniref:JmjC domain-containing protein n=1 Tax=Alternaria panax TaxID=48097 RepID=A0AAD4I7F1_9PLEO|nr:hypothetical protein G6011_08033 [Alternaria panax]